MAFTPDGRYGLSGDSYGILWLLDLSQGTKDPYWIPDVGLTPKGQDDPKQQGIRSVAVSADGKVALTGGDGQTLKLWDLEWGRQIRALKPAQAP